MALKTAFGALALCLSLMFGAAGTAIAQSRSSQTSHEEASNRSRADAKSASGTRVNTPVDPRRNEYVIGAGDVLAIDVWKEPEVSRVEPVRPDGRITLPLAGEIEATGRTTETLQAAIARRLSAYIQGPEVTVIVQKALSHRFNILGQVVKPGTYDLESRMTVLDAIAMAGGFREFAKLTHIYVVRREANGSSARLRFNYKDAVQGDARYLDLKLKPGDTVIVP